ncbi:uncharacterized protein LOC119613589 [Lucilia sericata]|uniref:uncharacterized protein LOC119613589 n=1 Tax=Lucilia sericata TaxID=13632 RepID=UPI0018A7FC66|nr:uncharacterized protein LOC119613589 [Lucilia sericata]
MQLYIWIPELKFAWIQSAKKIQRDTYITSLYKRINSIKEIASEVVNQCVIDEESQSTSTKAKSLTEFIKNWIEIYTSETNLPLLTELEVSFMAYEREQRLPLNGNILDYWCTKKVH